MADAAVGRLRRHAQIRRRRPLNAPDGGFAGAITAALFLRRFVPDGIPWAHLDTFAWRPSAKPGRPKGGDALGLRAAFAMLKTRYSG